MARGADVATSGADRSIRASGDGNTLLAAAIAAALARGGEVAGIECETGTTVYLDGENGEWEIHRRVHTLGLPAEGVRMADAAFNLREHFELLVELVHEQRPDLVVLDSLRSLTPGLDENDTKQTAAVLDPLRRLTHESGTAVLLIHHTNKSGKDFRGASRSATRATRSGTSVARTTTTIDRGGF